MKLEVGMYVRTKDRGIAKFYGWSAYDENKVAIHTHNEGDIEITPVIDKNTIIKASHNLLGNDKEPCLIEEGDYVNGYKVLYQDSHYSYFDTDTCDWIYIKQDEQIKSIVTKEQFESMEYKVGDE